MFAALLAGAGIAPAFHPTVALAQIRLPQRVNVGGANQNPPNQSDGIAMACLGPRFVVAWAEQAGTSADTQDIHVSISSDDGWNWSPPERVDLGDPPNSTDSDRPDVVITASGTILVAFEDAREASASGGTNEDLLCNRSTDGGLTWESSARAINVPTAGLHVSSDVDRATLCATGEAVYAAWEEDFLGGSQGEEELWFTSSTDGGATFAPARIVSGSGNEDVDDPALCAADLEILVAFVDDSSGEDDVWTLYSSDGGASFTRSCAEQSTAGDSGAPMLARDGPLVLLIWPDDDPAEVGDEALHAAVSQDGGRTFGLELSLAPDIEATPGARLLAASAAIAGDDIVVVHADDAQSLASGGPGGSDGARCHAAVSHDRGASWTLGIPLTTGMDDPLNRPVVTTGAGRFHVIFELGHAGSNRLATCLSPDRGHTFSSLIEIPDLDTDVDTEDLVEGTASASSATSGTALLGYWDQPTGSNELYIAGNGAHPSLIRYCEANPNSTGGPASIGAQGVPLLTGGQLVLSAEPVPATVGVFLFASNPMHAPFGEGWLCVVGQTHFLWPPKLAVSGRAEHTLDMSGPGITQGQRYFQYWFRDPAAGGSRFTTSDGLAVLFQ